MTAPRQTRSRTAHLLTSPNARQPETLGQGVARLAKAPRTKTKATSIKEALEEAARGEYDLKTYRNKF